MLTMPNRPTPPFDNWKTVGENPQAPAVAVRQSLGILYPLLQQRVLRVNQVALDARTLGGMKTIQAAHEIPELLDQGEAHSALPPEEIKSGLDKILRLTPLTTGPACESESD